MDTAASTLGWTGQSLPRVEDAALLRGRSRYLDDMGTPPGTLHAAILRSPHAHADITGIDAARARALPGVAAVLLALLCPVTVALGRTRRPLATLGSQRRRQLLPQQFLDEPPHPVPYARLDRVEPGPPANSPVPSASRVVLSSFMARSPPALERRSRLVAISRRLRHHPTPPHPRRYLPRVRGTPALLRRPLRGQGHRGRIGLLGDCEHLGSDQGIGSLNRIPTAHTGRKERVARQGRPPVVSSRA